jgi:hypothetical protein
MPNHFFRLSFAKIGNSEYAPSLVGRSGSGPRRPTSGKGAGERFFALGGRRSPLKRLISAKEIKGNPRHFSLILFGPAWLGFGEFG